MPFLKQKKVVSETKYKQPNIVMASIVYRAYKILTKNNKSHFESNILNEVKLLRSVLSHNQEATKSDYHRLRYRSTDIGYKALIDLSWNIITTNKFGKKHSGTNGLNFFLDVAELWENYIRSLLVKNFNNWQISSPEISLYTDNNLLKRSIIPDIVMQKDNDVIIFDTKYKRMKESRLDIDRTDFFQIHTYANYYQTKDYNVKMFGLIYPVDKQEHEQTIFSRSNINGIDYVVIGVPVEDVDNHKGNNVSIDLKFLEELKNAI